MSWVTILWSMAAACFLTLAGMHFMVWVYSRSARGNLLFALAASAAAALALMEMILIRAPSAAEYSEMVRWLHVPAGLALIAIVWFVRFFLDAGRTWLAWVITALRLLILTINFLVYESATFVEVSGLRHLELWGETFSVPIGEPNPWRLLIQLTQLIFVAYLLDAIVTLWRRGERRRALVFGGALVTTIVLSATFSQLMVSGILPGPFVTPIFMTFVLVMAFELSLDLVNARKIARQLRNSRQRIGLAVEAADLNLWEWNPSKDTLKILMTSPNRSEWEMYSQGSLDKYLEMVHPLDREQTRHAIAAAAERGGGFQCEFREVSPGGEIRWFSARGEVEYAAGGRPLLIRGVSLDITQNKHAELEALELRSKLAHASRVSALGQLSAVLAHEINQPLAAILRNAEAAEIFLAEDPPDLDELKEIIADIHRDDQRAAAVVERMRALIKRRKFELTVLDVDELVTQTTSLMKVEIQSAQVSLSLEVPDDLPKVQGDRVHLQQVIINLLLNSLEALKCTKMGQIKLYAAKSSDGMVELGVRDNGKGFPHEHLPRLFELFFTTSERGTGVGLAITKTIVELHGGSIIAENNPAGGATVRFKLQQA